MSTHKKDDEKAAKKAAGRSKAPDTPRTSGGEVDTARLKEQRREKPDESPAQRVERVGETAAPQRPAVVHPAPHLPGTPHPAGEDSDEAKPKDGDGTEAAAAGPGPVVPVSEGETPFPDHQAQNLYGLRKAGRLYRCRQEGLALLLIEADSPEQAREAYCAEMHRAAGDDPEAVKAGGRRKAGDGAGTMVPPGMALVPAETQTPKVNAAAVSVVKLAP